MVFPEAARLAPVPQPAEGGGGWLGPTVKGGAPGKVWLKLTPVKGIAALLVMVKVSVPVPIEGGLEEIGPSGLGEKAMVKVGGGTVTVRLIAAAVALGAWLLLRTTAGLVRDPAVVAVT